MEIQFHDIKLLDKGVIVNYLLYDAHGTADVAHILKKQSLLNHIKEHRLNVMNDGQDDEAELDLETYYEENYYNVAKAFVKWTIQNI